MSFLARKNENLADYADTREVYGKKTKNKYCLGFDLGLTIGVSFIQDTGRLLDFEALKIAVANTAGAQVHNSKLWATCYDDMRRVVLSSFGWACRHDGSTMVVAYERVDFSKAVWWAQLYGGILATLLQIVEREIGSHVKIIPINVSTVKKTFTGDSGASKERMAHVFQQTVKLHGPRESKFHSLGRSSQSDVIDAYAVALAGIRV